LPRPAARGAALTPGQPSWWRRDAAVAALGLALLLLWDVSGADLPLTRQFGNPQGFAWRDAWLTRTLLHDGGRLLGWALLAAMLLALCRAPAGGPARPERLRWLGAVLVCLLLVPALKRFSLTSCPWDLAEFGGVAAHVSHWRLGVADGGDGHCFPSGHAVAAFAFFALYFQWRRSRPALARGWLIVVCGVGLLFGLAQLARGAHFASHTLWSAWLCWTVCTLADRLPWPRQRLSRRAAAAPTS